MTTSASTQDYVKAIWKLHEWHSALEDKDGAASTALPQCVISPRDLAQETGMRASTVSGALARMTDQGYVMHAPYGGIQLTEKGRDLAIHMLRRHRIIETYLVRELSYTWDQVHEEAERLEHAASDMMIERMEERLGFPDRDPHGDPIPDRAGILPVFATMNVNLVPVGASAVLSRVNDDEEDLLRTLDQHGVHVDSIIRVVSLQEEDSTITLQAVSSDGTALSEPFAVSQSSADYIRVSRL
ncbi:hypothetical protein B9G54_03755 [Alloscardovia macacae]|uniref:Manganese transport regulator n=1 Tax=Alloscardovia macacae TaxID=1160091 RepID=A0A1Y2SY00_9BIFI|nr:metal-dependent transcriptional regulator [Alloscardovia macacae]OTA26702.1 hypothetical protein B9G54_03755 [Alloscardovia macacae]OTA29568.1 hypothetical protein B9T39_02905 [Alloscardovia macacae]